MRRWWLALVVALALLLGLGWLVSGRPAKAPDRPQLGLFTSLPILWAEADDVGTLLASPEPPHWARGELEARYRILPLDTLPGPRDLRFLLIAQPRPFSPDENVALDDWVRRGGRVLLFADPALTWDSQYPIGDRRRPQDVVLLSPILGRWGLELLFDDGQPGGERESAGNDLPVNLPGQLARRPGGVDAVCDIGPERLIARCRIGKGRALIVADAALLEPVDSPDSRAESLRRLADEAFAD